MFKMETRDVSILSKTHQCNFFVWFCLVRNTVSLQWGNNGTNYRGSCLLPEGGLGNLGDFYQQEYR